MRSAANASISRTESQSAPCSISSTRAILSSDMVVFSRFEFASEPYQKIDGGHPFRETSYTTPWETNRGQIWTTGGLYRLAAWINHNSVS